MQRSKIAVPLLVVTLLFQVTACNKEQVNQSTSISESKGLGRLFESGGQSDKPKDASANPVGIEEVLYDNGNIYGVKNGPIVPTVFTLNQPCKITSIRNYHYFNHGVMPGTITLKDQDGMVYGPWQAEGLEGQGNVANASWIVRPNIVVKAGTYTVLDSDPKTWSQNDQSGGCGFTEIKGIRQ